MKFASILSLAILLLVAGSFTINRSLVPDYYQLLFKEDFEDKNALKHFEMTDPSAWKITRQDDNRMLDLFGASEYEPRVRSPRNIAMITDQQFGSFVLEADVLQTGREYGHRDMCLFFGMKDPSNFYYTHLATAPDPHAHNIFLVNDEPRVAIAEKVSDGVEWGDKQWHKVKIERSLEDGSIKIYFDDMDNPIMQATDTHFDHGYIGFGSFDDTGRVDNIKIWGPKQHDQSGFFARGQAGR
ncbi:MAG: hypothetical protein WA960_07165 [Tunicatimonas sp.]